MAHFIPGQVSHERLFYAGVWSAQVVLASFFAVTALLKLVLHFDRLIEIMAWAAPLPIPLVRGLAVVELLGAIAVAAPAVTRTPQRIVGWAAVGFLTLMASAAIVHLARGEYRMIALNVAVGALAGFVAWGRLAHKPLDQSGDHLRSSL